MIDILMAAYNGEKFIKEQIDSILNQSCQDFQLWIRDDGSIDATGKMIEDYAKAYPEKIFLLQDQKGNLGVQKNFNELLKYVLKVSESEYYMFCDQDDIWLPEKLEKTRNKMQEVEQKFQIHEPNRTKYPVFIFTNLMLIDEKNNIISDSMWKYAGVDPNATQFPKLLRYNVATGCTVMINRDLACLVGSIPAGCDMHDYWIALVAASFGRIDYLSESLIKYRQHVQNQIGSIHKPTIAERIRKLTIFSDYVRSWRTEYEIRRKQAILLAKRYGKRYNKKDWQILVNYIKLPDMTIPKCLRALFYYKYWPEKGNIEKIKLILAVMAYKFSR